MSNVTPITQNLIEWCEEQFKLSGILDRVDHAGMYIHVRDPVGFKIEYYDRDGNIVPNYFRIRVHPKVYENQDQDDGNYNAPKISKYWQPKGLYQRLYWPKVLGVDHSANLCNASCPLFLVEGEKKALKLQSELLARGIQGSVAGLPGVRLGDDLLKELKSLTYVVKANHEEIHRAVFLSFDFGDKGRPEELTRESENKVRSTLRSVGADVIIMRWEADGPQKIDDWLVAGGDIKEAIQFSLAHKSDTEDELYELMLGINQHFAMCKGAYVCVEGQNKGSILTRTQFLDEHGHLYIETFQGKKIIRIYAAREWIDWADKRKMEGFCFLPPALGEPVQEWIDGRLNISPSWTPVDAPPFEMEYPTHLIDMLIGNFGENAEQTKHLKQHIAHAFLHPTKSTSQVAILCGIPGCGKSLLMDSFRKIADAEMLGGLVKSIRLDRKDDFNKEMEGTVIAIYEEPLKRSGKDVESIIKNLTGTKVLEIRAMRQDAYQVPNYVHLFVTMNLRYLSHLGKDDRRCNFYEGQVSIRPHNEGGNGFGAVYGAFMDSPQFLPTWHAWIRGVDLTGYSPQELGPPSKARTLAIGFSSTAEEDFFNSEEIAACDVWDSPQLMRLWEAHGNRSMNPTAFGRMLTVNGWVQSERGVSVDGRLIRLRAKDESWLQKPPKEWAEEYKKPKF